MWHFPLVDNCRLPRHTNQNDNISHAYGKIAGLSPVWDKHCTRSLQAWSQAAEAKKRGIPKEPLPVALDPCHRWLWSLIKTPTSSRPLTSLLIEPWKIGQWKCQSKKMLKEKLEIGQQIWRHCLVMFGILLSQICGKIFPNRRWHYSASWDTGQIQIWRIEIPKT